METEGQKNPPHGHYHDNKWRSNKRQHEYRSHDQGRGQRYGECSFHGNRGKRRGQMRRRTSPDTVQQEVNALFSNSFNFDKTSVKEPWVLPPTEDVFPGMDFKEEMDEWNFVVSELKQKLRRVQDGLSDKEITDWHSHTSSTHRGGLVMSHLRRRYHIELGTQAWCKFHEIVSTRHLIPSSCLKTGELNSVHICEAPGAFIASLNHFLQTDQERTSVDWRWLATSLNPHYEGNSPSCTIVDDRLILHTPDCWYFGEDNTGDVMSPENLQGLRQLITSRMGGVVNLVTADGSVNCQDDPSHQERRVFPLLYCQALTAVQILAPGGSFLIKMFTMFNTNTACLMYILNCAFEEVTVVKPSCSKAGNSEVYVICKEFCGTDKLQPQLTKLLEHFGPEAGDTPLFRPSDLPRSFVKELEECCRKFTESQVKAIRENLLLYQSPDEAKRQHIQRVREQCVEAYARRCHLRAVKRNQKLIPNYGSKVCGMFAKHLRDRLSGSLEERQEREHKPWAEQLLDIQRSLLEQGVGGTQGVGDGHAPTRKMGDVESWSKITGTCAIDHRGDATMGDCSVESENATPGAGGAHGAGDASRLTHTEDAGGDWSSICWSRDKRCLKSCDATCPQEGAMEVDGDPGGMQESSALTQLGRSELDAGGGQADPQTSLQEVQRTFGSLCQELATHPSSPHEEASLGVSHKDASDSIHERRADDVRNDCSNPSHASVNLAKGADMKTHQENPGAFYQDSSGVSSEVDALVQTDVHLQLVTDIETCAERTPSNCKDVVMEESHPRHHQDGGVEAGIEGAVVFPSSISEDMDMDDSASSVCDRIIRQDMPMIALEGHGALPASSWKPVTGRPPEAVLMSPFCESRLYEQWRKVRSNVQVLKQTSADDSTSQEVIDLPLPVISEVENHLNQRKRAEDVASKEVWLLVGRGMEPLGNLATSHGVRVVLEPAGMESGLCLETLETTVCHNCEDGRKKLSGLCVRLLNPALPTEGAKPCAAELDANVKRSFALTCLAAVRTLDTGGVLFIWVPGLLTSFSACLLYILCATFDRVALVQNQAHHLRGRESLISCVGFQHHPVLQEQLQRVCNHMSEQHQNACHNVLRFIPMINLY
ncbi:uncharacterized protein, partial [Diadema antillarum]|uniref:uncharacterized protein n=1 Tax=Diadema antillarum TaxID=105358 RepID=UPI003A85FBD5